MAALLVPLAAAKLKLKSLWLLTVRPWLEVPVPRGWIQLAPFQNALLVSHAP